MLLPCPFLACQQDVFCPSPPPPALLPPPAPPPPPPSIVRWGPAGICEISGHHSLQIGKYCSQFKDDCLGPPQNRSTLASVKCNVERLSSGVEPKSGSPIPP
eukprot:2066729-Pyramimonas_sp.AAC.1